MQKYFPNWGQQMHALDGEQHPNEAGYYLVTDADAHIAELERSHHATVTALKGELIQAQQAIQRMSLEAMAADGRLRAAKAHVADLEIALHQIRNSCVDEGDQANALFRLSPAEIRSLVDKVLMVK